MRLLGIDEAGRGCALGPLVVGAFLAEDVGEETLAAAGARDSKQITPRARERARAALAAFGRGECRFIEPSAIDAGNLNLLEEGAVVDLVRSLRPDRVVMDALGPPAALPALVRRLSARVGSGVSWEITPRADARFPVVGAASIFAKTQRDAALAAIRAEHGEVGSGYPSDPATRAWLARWKASGRPWPGFVRTRWATVRDLDRPGIFADHTPTLVEGRAEE